MMIGAAPVQVGDWLRDDADGYEGQVEAVDPDQAEVALRMHPSRTHPAGELRRVGIDRVHFNTWDAKFAAAGRTGSDRSTEGMPWHTPTPATPDGPRSWFAG